MKLSAFYREWAMELGFLVMVIGIMFLFFTSLSLFFLSQTPQLLLDVVRPLHETYWDMWLFFIGIMMLIIGVLMFFDKVLKLLEFKQLLHSDSRATFLKNRDRIEYLAWKLTKRQEDEYEEKLDSWRIKD